MTQPDPLETFKTRQACIIECERCQQLRAYGKQIAVTKRRAYLDWDYWGRPVPDFGAADAGMLIVGLAPGAHGAHRTGRMFTGDRSGEWLYRSLFNNGFANQPESTSIDDGLTLDDCLITAVAHCAPPDNRPTLEEQHRCQDYLEAALAHPGRKVVVCLGQIAWNAAFRIQKLRGEWHGARPKFGHGSQVETDRLTFIGSYHPSQQNTLTGRLTREMLDQIFATARQLLESNKGTS